MLVRKKRLVDVVPDAFLGPHSPWHSQVIRTAGGQLGTHQGRACRGHLRAWHAGKLSTLWHRSSIPWITIIYPHIHLSLISQLEMFKRWIESPASCLYNPLLYLVMTGRLVSGLRNTYNMLSWFRIFGGGCIHFEENIVSNIINSPLVELLQLTRNTEKILPCNIIKKYWHFESY